MYCTSCGNEVGKGEKFCTKCGAILDMDLYTKRTKPKTKKAPKEAGRTYSLGDLGKDGIPGSKVAAFGLVITLLSIIMGSMGLWTVPIALLLLIIAYCRGFRSIWIWIGISVCALLFIRALWIFCAEVEASAYGGIAGFLSIFF